MVIEQRKERGIGTTNHTDPMKGITKKTVEELIQEVRAAGLTVPPKPTRGVMIRMLRDEKSTEADSVINFGRYAGYYYREVPRDYKDWVLREMKVGSSHPDLVRFGNWIKETDGSSNEPKIPHAKDDPEANAKVEPPRVEPKRNLFKKPGAGSTSGSDGSWACVPKQSGRLRRRERAEEDEVVPEAMAQEVPQEARDEIARIEMQLAAIKQKHGLAPKAGVPEKK